MRIDERILTRHLEAAAIEQLRSELEANGYEVRTDVPLDGGGQPVSMDLVACRGQERIYYEIKVLGEGRAPANKQLSRLAQAARDGGGQFRLALVRPGRRTEVAVAGIEEALRRALSADPTGVIGRLGSGVTVEDVTEVEIDRIEVGHGGKVEVAGAAALTLDHSAEPGAYAFARSQLPFTFRVTIGSDGRVVDDPVPEYKIDVSEWIGDKPGSTE
jgi:Holliday junction resolvase